MTAIVSGILVACGGGETPAPVKGLSVAKVASFESPWAVAELPDGRVLVTDNGIKTLNIVDPSTGVATTVAGMPARMEGLYAVRLGPDGRVWITFAEPDAAAPRLGRQAASLAGKPPSGLAVVSADLGTAPDGRTALINQRIVWRQAPKLVTQGQYGGHMAFSPDGQHVFISAGDLQEFEGAAQNPANTLGKIVRLRLDGGIPADNPFVGKSGYAPEIWTMGHRNPYGLAFGTDGTFYLAEHGPQGGDEFNRIRPGANYGWPLVSYGNHYSGDLIPKPKSGDGFEGALITWTPAIAPGGMVIVSGSTKFAAWRGDAIIAGLKSQSLIRVRLEGDGRATEVERLTMPHRIRDVTQAADGSLLVLEDPPSGRLLRAMPTF